MLTKCPVVAPTDQVNISDSRNLEIILVVKPNRMSYLFHEHINSSSIKCFRVSFASIKGELWIDYKDSEDNPIETHIFKSGEMKVNNGVININSIISNLGGKDVPMHCFKPILEEIRIWVYRDIMVIWSCVEDYRHEEDIGILLLAYRPKKSIFKYYDNPKSLKVILMQFKTILEKILPKNIMERIPFDEERQVGRNCTKFDPFSMCPIPMDLKYERHHYFGVLLMILLYITVIAIEVGVLNIDI